MCEVSHSGIQYLARLSWHPNIIGDSIHASTACYMDTISSNESNLGRVKPPRRVRRQGDAAVIPTRLVVDGASRKTFVESSSRSCSDSDNDKESSCKRKRPEDALGEHDGCYYQCGFALPRLNDAHKGTTRVHPKVHQSSA